mmetsp:Transcript_6092/g.7374  ORF Transcript_6092/g.7374 Transcript_6092/m.7374 type:complete len:237 (+) Transcript_6092:3-713(+)
MNGLRLSLIFCFVVFAPRADATCADILSTKSDNNCFDNPFQLKDDEICSGRGICGDVDGCCICDRGWRGSSDFVDGEGIDCQINYVLIKILWTILLLESLYFFYSYAGKIRLKIENHVMKKRAELDRGREFRMEVNTILALTAYFLMAPIIALVSILKLGKVRRIGGDFGMTLLWFLGRTIFWILAQYHQNVILKNLVGGFHSPSAMRVHYVGTSIVALLSLTAGKCLTPILVSLF